MPYAACDACGLFFVVDREESPQNRCSKCNRPLRTASRDEGLAFLRRLRQNASGRPGPRTKQDGGEG